MFTSSPISLVLLIVIYSNNNSYSNLALLQQLFLPHFWLQYYKWPDHKLWTENLTNSALKENKTVSIVW